MAVDAQVGINALAGGGLSQLNADNASHIYFRWTAYGIPWDLVGDYSWAEVYRCVDMGVKRLSCMLHCIPCYYACCLLWSANAFRFGDSSDISTACCRQLDALPDVVVRSVGQSCRVNSNWSELLICDEQSVYEPGTISYEFDFSMQVCYKTPSISELAESRPD